MLKNNQVSEKELKVVVNNVMEHIYSFFFIN